MNPQDVEMMERMVPGSVDDILEQEYMYRYRMYHRSGATGPLGSLALVDLLRHLGLTPPKPGESVGKTDWKDVPLGNIVATSDGREGEFVGLIANGTVGVRFPDSPQIIEFRAFDVTPGPRAVPEDVIEDLPQEPDKVPEVYQEANVAPEKADVDWTKLSKGQELWVKLDGDMYDATLIKKSPGPKKVTVKLKGSEEERVFSKDLITVPA